MHVAVPCMPLPFLNNKKRSLTLPKELLHLEAAAADTILGGGRQLCGCIIGQKITIYFQLKVGITVALMSE